MSSRRFKPLRRPGKRPAPPLNAQVEYLRRLKVVLRAAVALVHARLMPRLDRWLIERDDARTPRSAQVSKVIDGIRETIDKRFTAAKLTRLAGSVADEVSSHQKEAMAEQISIALPARADRGLGAVIDAFTHENVALISSVPSQYLDGVQSTVLAGISSGMRHEDIAKALVEKAGVASNRAALIARDQVLKFNGRLTEVRQTNLGITSYIWHTVEDERVRESHMERDGETFEWADPPGDLADPGDGGHPGNAINCVPGDTLVSFNARATKAYRHWYSGDLAEFITDTGKPLRTTPNHPVLTQRGWLPAHLVEVGDYLVEAPDEGALIGVKNDERREARADDVFEACRALGSLSISLDARGGFHGDAVNEQVDIVNIHGPLALDKKTSLLEDFGENAFSGPFDSNACESPRDACLMTSFRTSHGVVRSFDELFSFLGRQGLPTPEHRFTASRHADALPAEGVLDSTSRTLETYSNLIHADLLTQPGLNLIKRKVESVVRTPFSGWVFNYETSSGWFVAHGLILHNCRCYAEGIIPGLDDDEP